MSSPPTRYVLTIYPLLFSRPFTDQCPGGLRLHGIRYPLSGLRVFGNKLVEAGCSFVAPIPAVMSAPSLAHPVGYNTFCTAPTVSQNAPNISCPPHHVASPAPPVAFAGFTAPSTSPLPAPCPATISAHALPIPVIAVPSQPATNETRQMSFQQSKKPGTFSVGGASSVAAARPSGVGKTSAAPRRS